MRRKHLINITMVVVLTIVLLLVLIEIRPRTIHLGNVKTEVAGRKKAIQILIIQATRHPLSRQISVSWKGQDIRIRTVDSRLEYKPLQKMLKGVFFDNVDSGVNVMDISCSKMTLNRLRQEVENSDQSWFPADCGCSITGGQFGL